MAQGSEGKLYCMNLCKVDFMQQEPGFQPNSQEPSEAPRYAQT